jgi:hypothetical protein
MPGQLSLENQSWSVQQLAIKNYVLAPKDITENIYVEKTYHIRKVGGGLQKKRVSVGSTTPCYISFL